MSIMDGVPKNIARMGRNTTMILFAAQSLISTDVSVTATVLSILGEQLAAAPFAYVLGMAWDRMGKCNGLAALAVASLMKED